MAALQTGKILAKILEKKDLTIEEIEHIGNEPNIGYENIKNSMMGDVMWRKVLFYVGKDDKNDGNYYRYWDSDVYKHKFRHNGLYDTYQVLLKNYNPITTKISAGSALDNKEEIVKLIYESYWYRSRAKWCNCSFAREQG